MGVAIVQAARGTGRLIGRFSWIEGTFLHPNPFSIYRAVLIVMAVALLRHVHGTTRWLLLSGTAGATVLLLLTYTRGSWIALVVGLLVVGAIQSRALLVGVAGGAVVVALFISSVTARFADLNTPTQFSGAPANSLIWRVDYWRETVDLSRDSPLAGIGLKGIKRLTADSKNADNDIVRVYVETGLLGLADYLALAWSMVTTARRTLRATTSGWQRGLAVGFAGVVSVLAVVSISSNVITQVVLLWYAVALAMVAASLAARRTDLEISTAHVPTRLLPTQLAPTRKAE